MRKDIPASVDQGGTLVNQVRAGEHTNGGTAGAIYGDAVHVNGAGTLSRGDLDGHWRMNRQHPDAPLRVDARVVRPSGKGPEVGERHLASKQRRAWRCGPGASKHTCDPSCEIGNLTCCRRLASEKCLGRPELCRLPVIIWWRTGRVRLTVRGRQLPDRLRVLAKRTQYLRLLRDGLPRGLGTRFR